MKISSQQSLPLCTQTVHPAEADKQKHVNTGNDSTATQTAGLPHLHDLKRSRPAWLKQALFHDDTAAQTGKRLRLDQESSSSRRWEDDLSGAHCLPDEFRLSIHRHLAYRWANDRSVALDQIGSSTYASMRRAQLQEIPGAGYLAEQYGLQTVKNCTPRIMQSGLRIDNESSPIYQRDQPSKQFQIQCQLTFSKLQGKEYSWLRDHGVKMVFVNSKLNASRILSALKDWKPDSVLRGRLKSSVTPVARGLVAIEFSHMEFALEAEKLLARLGGQPSAYQVGKLAYEAHHPSDPSVRLQEGIDNSKTLLEVLSADDKGAISRLRKLPAGHAMQATADCAASLLDGLRQALARKADTPAFKQDLLIADALNALANTARALPVMTEDSSRFFAGYAAMLEEMHLLLASAKPYEETDFKSATQAMLAARTGSSLAGLHIAAPETYLLSSGMEAMSMGIEIARMLANTKGVRTLAQQKNSPDYYEVKPLTSPRIMDRVRIAVLNSSFPGKENADDTVNNWDAEKLTRQTNEWLDGWNAEKLVRQAMAWLTACFMQSDRPAVLVLDTTIEKKQADGKSDLATVLGDLRPYIDDGRLKIVLCKSYQKYTALGSAKTMAGGITLIARDDAKTRAAAARLREAEEDLGWMHHDESQLFTHFLTHAHASELEMIGKAAENAAFISRFCFDALRRSGKFKVRGEDGLPFVLTTAGSQKIAFATQSWDKQIAWKLLHQVEFRFSFAFLSTSTSNVITDDNWLRITAGQETREELVEKLSGFAWLHDAGVKECTPTDLLKAAERIAADAMQGVLGEADVMSWAQTALQVLGSRASRGRGAHAAAVSECDALLEEIAGLPATVEARSGNGLKERKELLRQKLATALNASEPLAENLLSDHLRIVGSAFAPRVPDAMIDAKDVDAMRTAIKGMHDGSPMPDDDAHVRYAPNAIASLLAMAGLAFSPKKVLSRYRQDLESFYSAALDAGLPCVSPSTRALIVLGGARFQIEKLHSADKEVQRAAVHELVRHLRLSPYREIGAKILASIPDEAFARLERSVQRQLIDALFTPLDAGSRIETIKRLVEGNGLGKLSVCIERFGEDLRQSDEGASNMLSPDGLSGKAELLSDEPRSIAPEEREAIRRHLLMAVLQKQHRRLGVLMASWAPWICHDEKSAHQLAEVSRALEAAQSVSGKLSDAQYQALADQVSSLPMPYMPVMQQYFEGFMSKRQA